MPPRLMIFDFDGTLADSLATAVGIFNRLADELGHKPIVDVAAARSLTTRQFLKQHGVSFWRLPRLVRGYLAAVAEEAERLELFAGLTEAFATLRTHGIRLGVLSSNREDNIRRCLRANSAEEHFSFVVGYPKLFGKGKALRRILRTERLSKEDVVYVGDEVRDVEAARKAGVRAAAVTWGFHAESLLRVSRPDHVVTEPRQLVEIVRGMRSVG